MYRQNISKTIHLHLVALAIALVIAGCGSGSETSPSGPNAKRYFGDHPGQEETKAAIGAGDCRALRLAAEHEVGSSLATESEPTPPASRCYLRGRGARISIYLDTAYAARQRYSNRMVEQMQFYAAVPAKRPHPVPGVGDPGAYGHNASWIPALSTLYAVRGNRWLTVTYSVAGTSQGQRQTAAAALARRGFRLTAR